MNTEPTTTERDGWTIRTTNDRNRPGHVLLNARRGALVLNLDRIPTELADHVNLTEAWHNRPYLPATRPALELVTE